jgi:hypothetical protein
VFLTVAFRRSISRLLIGVIASAQVAIGAYACASILGNGLLANGQPGSTAFAMSVDMPTDGPALVLPNLCLGHCQYGHQSSDHTPAPAVPAALLALLTTRYTLPAPERDVERLHPLAKAGGLPAAADPPHAILHCCRRD